MAARRPSLIRLKQIEVMKIITPGSAASDRIDVDRLAQRVQHQAPFRLGGFTPRPRKLRPAARMMATLISEVA